MELYQLISFVNVARSGNLTHSAHQMNISLSALSSQIKNLEQSLHTPLFIRSPKGMQLTDNGKIVYKSAIKVVDAAKDLESVAAGFEKK